MIITYRKIESQSQSIFGFGFTGNRELLCVEISKTDQTHVRVGIDCDTRNGISIVAGIFKSLICVRILGVV